MKLGVAGNLAKAFIQSKLTVLLIIAILVLGFYSIYLTPSEEEPQINVPIADIYVQYIGANPTEIESRVAEPLEKMMTNIPGVEYVYSTSMPGMVMVTVQFYVNEDFERSVVKLYNEIMKNMDKMPKGVSMPLVKTRSIDDVPILSFSLWSKEYDDYQLRRIASELSNEINKVKNVSEVKIIGGRKRKLNIKLDKDKMAGLHVDPLIVMMNIQKSNHQSISGKFNNNDKDYFVKTGNFLKNKSDLENLVVGVFNGSPVYLSSVAQITDGPEDPENYTSYGLSLTNTNKTDIKDGIEFPSVTLSVSKIKNSDAKVISKEVINKIEYLKGKVIPANVNVTVTRNYGNTASEKVEELLTHLLVAILAASFIVALFLGWRGGLVVLASVPITFSLTLFVYYMFGYTLNRITLFALVFVTGIVVDDSIIIVENMHRHFKMKKQTRYQAALTSIDEVGNPTILSTFTVIAAILPMAFVSGLMGPYMAPMPIGASLSTFFSLLVALVITPYIAFKFLKTKDEHTNTEKKYDIKDRPIYKFYEKTMSPLMESTKRRWVLIFSVVFLLLASVTLVYFKLVTVKMLPFDNKNEIQVIIDMPEGTTLERTAAVTKEIAGYLRTVPEVVNYQTYVGTAAPINFNGLVRHYDLRRGSNVADIQINLLDKGDRSEQSHDIAKKIRPGIDKIAKYFNANVKIAEVPPGPPVLSTLVAEVYGPNYQAQIDYAKKLKNIFENTNGVVDVDWYVEGDQTEYKFVINKKKAAILGVTSEQIVGVMGISLNGKDVSLLYQPNEDDPLYINIRLKEDQRSDINNLKGIKVMSNTGNLIPISELVEIKNKIHDKSIYRKNQKRVVYVTGDIAGRLESPIYAIQSIDDKINELNEKEGLNVEQFYTHQPEIEENVSVKWDGEWQITYEVFRDLGIAFGVVLIVIYMLIIGWFQSFKTPFIMMVAIPLSLVGILVAHLIFGAFFTATSMIGAIALAGIMVRNSILLIDFIELRLADSIPLKQAIIESGAVRTTPILLTAGAVIIGAFIIIFDPIFQGLALALIGGAIVSTALTLLMVPIIYYMAEHKKYETNKI